MAYRFLLEVPETLADAASIAVERVGDAQVLVARPSHGLGVDDPYVDMTVAAHSLRVVDSLFDWYEAMSPPRPEVRMVLHGGERHGLENVDRGRMVALIRRDQPWVERSIPHIGDHEPVAETPRYSVGPGATRVVSVEVTARGNAPAALVERERDAVGMAPTGQPAAALQIRAINYILVQVNDLRKAEVFYQDFFGMQLLGRVRRGPDGTLVPLPSDYSWDRALQTGELADTTFLSNGPLTLAVQSVGLGVVLGQGALQTVSIGVDSHTFATFKGEVVMRPLTVLRSGVASFIFRDPFNINWEVAVLGSVPLIPV
ncbi:MAG: VOC family protein [Chloroflexi bacterium]|nr:VOC family protein [Chloroflexota bacterium]